MKHVHKLLPICLTLILSPAVGIAQDKNTPKISFQGRYTLQIVSKGEDHVLYRLDTLTGIVSVFDPTAITSIADEDWLKLGTEMKRIAEEEKLKGRFVYEATYWKPLPEKLEGFSVK